MKTISPNLALDRVNREPDMLRLMNTTGLLLAVAVALLPVALPTLGDTPQEEFSAREHHRIDHEDGGEVYFFIVRSEALGGPASLAAIELKGGERVLLLAKFDLENGTSFQRLDDLSSGWSAELAVESGLEHMAAPGTVGGGSTGVWLEHLVELTRDPSYWETVSVQTADGGMATWQISGDTSPREIQSRKEAAVTVLGQQIQETPPPVTSRRAVALITTVISENSDSMLDHFDGLITALAGAFAVADLPALGQDGEGQRPASVRIPLSESEDEVQRMRRSLKTYVRSSLD